MGVIGEQTALAVHIIRGIGREKTGAMATVVGKQGSVALKIQVLRSSFFKVYLIPYLNNYRITCLDLKTTFLICSEML